MEARIISMMIHNSNRNSRPLTFPFTVVQLDLDSIEESREMCVEIKEKQ